MTRNKLQICHITSMHAWDDDRIYERACIGLSELGCDVSLIATPESLNKNSETGISFKEGDQKNGVKLYWIKKRHGLKRRIFSSLEVMKRAARLKPDIIHFHDPDILPWAFLYTFFYKGIIVYDIHENYCSRIVESGLPQWLKSVLSNSFRGFEKRVINRIGGYVTTTDTMKNLYAGVSKPGISVSNVPFLYRLKTIPVDISKYDKVTIITSGTNSDARNCMQTIEAVPLVLQKFPDTIFKFVGRYDEGYEDKLLQKAKELKVEHAVAIEGMLPWLENFERVAKAHIGCVFYADNLNNRVTIPNRLFEYMAMGLAIIGEAFPEVVKVVDDAACGITVNSSNPASIAEGICKLLNDKTHLSVMSKNAVDAINNKYNYENELKKLDSFYIKLIN